MILSPDTVVAITGASRGIGAATALALARRGVRLSLLARSADALRALEPELRAAGAADVFVRPGDVASPDADAWIAETIDRFDRIDALVNNAGLGIMKPIEELTDADWRSVLDTNLTGPFRTIRAALPAMRRRGGGHVVNVSSIAGEVGFAGGGAYCASKFGLQGLTECLLHEARRDGVKATILAPGSVDTRFDAKTPGADASWKIPPEEIARTIVHLLESPDHVVATKVQLRPTLKGKK